MGVIGQRVGEREEKRKDKPRSMIKSIGTVLRSMTDLFAAAGLEKSAPGPLADRLRPKTLAEVVARTTSSGRKAR